MAVRIRMTRTGARNCICYRVVVTDSRSPRDGATIENLGWYDPKQKGVNFEINEERIRYWRDRGADVSNTVRSLIKRAGRARREAAKA